MSSTAALMRKRLVSPRAPVASTSASRSSFASPGAGWTFQRRPASIASSGSLAANSALNVFDSATKIRQKNRAASDKEFSRVTDYVRDEVAGVMVDRLLDIKRRYPTVMDLYSGSGHLAKQLESELGTTKCIMVDAAERMLYRDADDEFDVDIERILLQDPEYLPFEEDSQDCILSSIGLHWINDLLGVLIQARRTLRPDCPLLLSMFGGDTLFELRTSLQLASLERHGGLQPRISPMTDSASLSNLISRAGFAMPTIDVDEITINYPSMFELMEDLRGMGESNATWQRGTHLGRDELMAAASIYKELHGNPDGTIPATFQILFGIGWKPAPNQPKPAERGSGQVSLKDALGEGSNQGGL